MEWYTALLIIFGPFIILLALGMPVAFTFIFIMIVGAIALIGSPTGPYMTVLSFFNSIAVFSLAPVPLFVFMGEVLLHSGLAIRSIDALSELVGRVPARLSILANLSGALFGMLCGSTMASTAVLGTSLVPEMRKRKYSKALSFGPILASGGLAMIIPPSSLAIIYGTIAQVSIGRLLLAGLVPGFMMAVIYMAQIIIRAKLNPSLAPRYEVKKISFKQKTRLFCIDVLPLSIIIFLVTGIFILGIATPTEAAALGATGTVVVALFYRCLSFKTLFKAVSGTVSITSMTLLLIGGSEIFSQLLSYSGITRVAVSYAVNLNLPPLGLLLSMLLIVLFLGTFLESVPIMMVTIPIFIPIAAQVGFDPIWLGILILITIQIGLTTPPFGLLLFVMKGVAPPGTTISDLYRAAFPFVLCDLFTITLLILFPIIILWLPNLIIN